jgi:hypothetical protein
MLDHPHADHRQLLDLVTHRLAKRDMPTSGEEMAALTLRRPVLDHFIDRPCRQQWPALALMAGLSALRTTRGILPAPCRRTRWIGTRRLRAITRTAIQPTLQLSDALILTRDPRTQRLDLRVHPQQNINHRLAPRVIDRLRLSALHTQAFDDTELSPQTH